jgi:mono/diheme cytochrome c family protein
MLDFEDENEDDMEPENLSPSLTSSVKVWAMSALRMFPEGFRGLRIVLWCGLVCLAAAPAFRQTIFAQTPVPPGAPGAPHPFAQTLASREALTNIAVDSVTQVYHAKPGDLEGTFAFWVTNISDTPVHILSITASCSCTKAEMPRTPWILLPHTTELFRATMSLVGKPAGDNTKVLTVTSTNGVKILWVKSIIPAPEMQTTMADRLKNQELAKSDRQSIFRNDCVQCHVTPAAGKMGKELYDKACGICHDSDHRAAMITDLGSLNHPVDAEFWKTIISNGKPATMMPAFAQDQGGPLTKEQVNSLVDYFMSEFGRTHQPTPQVQIPEGPMGRSPRAAGRPIPLPPPQISLPAHQAAASPAAQHETK